MRMRKPSDNFIHEKSASRGGRTVYDAKKEAEGPVGDAARSVGDLAIHDQEKVKEIDERPHMSAET
jgi:hypothetical protein